MTEIIPQQAVQNKARKDKFILFLSLPRCFRSINVGKQQVPDNTQVNLDSLQFSIYGSPVPDISVPELAVPFSGQTTHISSHTREAYTPLTVTFTVDNQFKNYWYLWKWLDFLNGASKGVADPNNITSSVYERDARPSIYNVQIPDYTADVSIMGYAEYNEPVIEFKYKGALITKLGRIDFNYRDSGEMECSFTFAFSQFEAKLTNINP